jgi:hypothetical protein
MSNYIIYDANGNYENVIVCEENDILPEGYTKKLIPHGYKWDGEKIIRDITIPIVVETI